MVNADEDARARGRVCVEGERGGGSVRGVCVCVSVCLSVCASGVREGDAGYWCDTVVRERGGARARERESVRARE